MIPGGGSGQGGVGGVMRERRTDTDSEDFRIRARALNRDGKVVGQWFVRGLPPGDETAKAAYVEAVTASEQSAESARERESIPLEDRELVRDYHNRIKRIE